MTVRISQEGPIPDRISRILQWLNQHADELPAFGHRWYKIRYFDPHRRREVRCELVQDRLSSLIPQIIRVFPGRSSDEQPLHRSHQQPPSLEIEPH
jgi:hypothetical protein